MDQYKVAYGDSRQARKWRNATITWAELRERLSHPLRTGETMQEYSRMKSAGKSAAKDKGGFVAGELKEGKRSASTVECRSMLTMDLDQAKPDFLTEYTALSPYSTFIYSTHSHTAAAPRLRLVVPLTRDINADEYQAITRLFAAEQDITQFDPCSFIPSQLMFWPTVAADGEYVFEEVEGTPLDPDVFLSRYPKWKDPTSLPTTVKEKPLHGTKGWVEDPLTKEGIVGTFCRCFSIAEVIERFLSDIYEPAGNNRYRFIPSSSLPGVIVFDDKWSYSNHATDPAYHLECNAFDLVRIHLFSDEDDKKSFEKMAAWAASLPEVGKALLEERQASAQEDFLDLEEGEDWQDKLLRGKNGELINCLHNIGLIINYDPALQGIVFNELADGMEVKGSVPWERGKSCFWRDADDAQLIWYIDQNYGSFSQRNYDVAVTKFTDDRRYHPVKQYLESLPPWDGTPRVDKLLIDYLGAADTPYVKTVTRKTLCAAIARVYNPGIKFDNMLVLNGPQGIGKSTIISRLAMDWFSDSLTLSDMNDGKAAPEKLQGYWIHEIGEMAGMRKADLEKVKSFITRQDDKYRAAFARRVTSHPRQCIFFGTTNAENGFLRDVTGNRRFWPVQTPGGKEKHPWDLTREDIDMVWAEVLHFVKKGEPLFLPGELEKEARKEQAAAMETDEREGLVRQYLDTLLPENWNKMDLYARREFLDGDDPTMPKGTIQRDTVSNMEIWCECFRNSRESLHSADSYTIKSIMSHIEGWQRTNEHSKSKPYGKQQVYKRV